MNPKYIQTQSIVRVMKRSYKIINDEDARSALVPLHTIVTAVWASCNCWGHDTGSGLSIRILFYLLHKKILMLQFECPSFDFSL